MKATVNKATRSLDLLVYGTNQLMNSFLITVCRPMEVCIYMIVFINYVTKGGGTCCLCTAVIRAVMLCAINALHLYALFFYGLYTA